MVTVTISKHRPAWSLPIPQPGQWYAYRITTPQQTITGIHRGNRDDCEKHVEHVAARLENLRVGRLPAKYGRLDLAKHRNQ